MRAPFPRPLSPFPVFAQVPNAAAQRAIISGVRSVPTMPRTPDTLIIRVSGMAAT
jgi:hypothetical protein